MPFLQMSNNNLTTNFRWAMGRGWAVLGQDELNTYENGQQV